MPAGVLTGFHGKLPGAGDFVTRGLPTGFAAFWDGFAARHLAGRQGWPAGGLRLRLQSGGRVAAGVVVPGVDRVGRRFPLAAFVIAPDLPDAAALESWCEAALAALTEAQAAGETPDALADALEALVTPEGAFEGATLAMWRRGGAALDCNPSNPGPVLDLLFSCSESSSP